MTQNTQWMNGIIFETPPLANIAGALMDATRYPCGEVLRKFGPSGRDLTRYWKDVNRRRRDDPPPAAAAVLV